MFTSKRKLFSSERGSATSWLAGITATALLIGTAALPAVADETVTASDETDGQRDRGTRGARCRGARCSG